MPRIPRHRPMARYPAAKKPETSSPVRKRHGCGFSPTVGKRMQRQTDADKRIPQTRSPSSWTLPPPRPHLAVAVPLSLARMAYGRWQKRRGRGRGRGCASPVAHPAHGGLDALPSPLPPPDPYSFPDLISSSTASSSLHEVEVRLCLVALPASRPFTAAARRWGQKQDMQGFAGPSHCSCISFLFTDFVVWPQASHSSGPHRWSEKKVRNFAFETILNPAFAGPATLPPSDG